ncbi:MAG TPA: isoprenylcysteine carboxylmethyltransferase family protein [Actinomycetota bacterium]|nr:isoprenylcysteine carboxylmethyltransferase family protein [Actinomycetota bacterium]
MNHVIGSDVPALVNVGLTTCWVITGIVWVAGALYNAQRGPRAQTRLRASNVWTILVVAALAVTLNKVFPGSDSATATVRTSWVQILGLAFLVCSTVFTLWARVALGTMWSSTPTVKIQHQLRTGGPYAVARHPIYTGLLGMLLGSVLMVGVGPWLVAFVVYLVFIEIRIHFEEKLMLESFPEAYSRYRRAVPQLVPGLRRLHRSRPAHT